MKIYKKFKGNFVLKVVYFKILITSDIFLIGYSKCAINLIASVHELDFVHIKNKIKTLLGCRHEAPDH